LSGKRGGAKKEEGGSDSKEANVEGKIMFGFGEKGNQLYGCEGVSGEGDLD